MKDDRFAFKGKKNSKIEDKEAVKGGAKSSSTTTAKGSSTTTAKGSSTTAKPAKNDKKGEKKFDCK